MRVKDQRQGYLHRRTLLRGIAGSAGVALLAACGGKSGDKATTAGGNAPFATIAPGKQAIVAATTTQIQDFVKNVGGNRVTVSGILKPNVDPHDYEPTVEDANVIAKADIVFVHGVGLDAWMDKTIKTGNTKAPVITATSGIKVLKGDENEPEGDPHLWFDPTLVQTMVINIAGALAKVDPANAVTYQANAKAYGDQLTQLDNQLRGIFNQVPKEQRKLVTNHDAFQYLAKRYDLTIIGAVIPSISDTAEPSAKQVNDLIDTIKKERVKAIFAESSANPTVAQQVAKETGIAIIDTLYGDTLGEPGSDGDTYLKMMAYDATTIANALK
jgi:ABC-type Zn uptake system ZnuABC Zn-binding protein ZnuA